MSVRRVPPPPRRLGALRVPAAALAAGLAAWGAGACPATARGAALPPSNLIANPCFSSGTKGWQGYRSTLAAVPAADAPCGSTVARVSSDGSGGGYTIDTSPAAVVAGSTRGMTYTGTAWVKGDGSSDGRLVALSIREFTDGREVARATSSPVVLSGGYQELSVRYSARQSGDQINMFVARTGEVARSGDAFLVGDLGLATVPAANLMANPSFESGVSGWDGWHARLAPVAQPAAPDGAEIARVTGTATGGYAIDGDAPAPVAHSTAGMTYTASAWIRGSPGSAAKPARLGIREWHGGAVLAGARSDPVALSGRWQRITVSYTARRTGDVLDMYLGRSAPTVPGESFDVDDFWIAAVPAANLIADPSFESGLGGWTAWSANSALTRTPASDAPDGFDVVRVTSTRPGEHTLDDVDAAPQAVGAGGPAAATQWPEIGYRASAWVRDTTSSAGQPLALHIREWHQGRAIADAAAQVSPSADAYTHVTATLTPRYGGDRLDVYLAQPDSAAGQSFLADDVTLAAQPGAPASDCPEAFGSFAPGAWPPACWRPYDAGSIFNTPIPADAEVASDSLALIDFMAAHHWTLQRDGDGNFAFGSSGDVPVYWSRGSDPTVKVACTGDRGRGYCDPAMFGTDHARTATVRIPVGAQPEPGSDAHMAVVDQASGAEYDFWQARHNATGAMTVSSGCRLPIGPGSGTGLDGCARAVPVGLLGGLIRAPELGAGRIDHALILSIPCTASGRSPTFPGYVFPADSPNGAACPAGVGPQGPPLGALLQLTWTPEQIAASGAPPWQQAIMNALHTYGAYVVDTNAPGDETIALGQEDERSSTSFPGYAWGPLCSGPAPACDGPMAAVVAADGGSFDAARNTWTLAGLPLPLVSDYGQADAAPNFRIIAPCVALGTCP